MIVTNKKHFINKCYSSGIVAWDNYEILNDHIPRVIESQFINLSTTVVSSP